MPDHDKLIVEAVVSPADIEQVSAGQPVRIRLSTLNSKATPELSGKVTGDDIDGYRGTTTDLQARVFLRWNIFDGGINQAKYQEMVRRASETRYRLLQVTREAEQDVRTAWATLNTQGRVTSELTRQSQVSDDLLLSYRNQFNVGRRSLLDVLDAQNTRYNVQVRLETARFSEMFARYQTLAATNRLLTALNVAPGAGAGQNDRERFNYGPPKPAELQYRTMARSSGTAAGN